MSLDSTEQACFMHRNSAKISVGHDNDGIELG